MAIVIKYRSTHHPHVFQGQKDKHMIKLVDLKGSRVFQSH